MPHNDHSTLTIAHTAALLEAVARIDDESVDPAVPIRCGMATDALRTSEGFSSVEPIADRDTAADIALAIESALALLIALPPDDITDDVLGAIADVQAAADALRTRADP